MQNKFVSKLKFVWNSIKSMFEKFKKNCGYFFHSIKLTFAAKKVHSNLMADAKKKQKQFEADLAEKNEKASFKKRMEENEKKENGVYITPGKVRNATLHFFDFIASMIFISAVVVCLKPMLLSKWIIGLDVFETELFKFADAIGRSLLNVDILDDVFNDFLFDKLIPLRNIVVTVSLSVYVLIKLLVILFSKDSNKLVSLLLLILLVLICFLAGNKFLLLIIFTVVLYLTFQIACFMPTKAILRKLLWIVIFTLAGYFVVHLILYPGFADKIKTVFESLRLPSVKMW